MARLALCAATSLSPVRNSDLAASVSVSLAEELMFCSCLLDKSNRMNQVEGEEGRAKKLMLNHQSSPSDATMSLEELPRSRTQAVLIPSCIWRGSSVYCAMTSVFDNSGLFSENNPITRKSRKVMCVLTRRYLDAPWDARNQKLREKWRSLCSRKRSSMVPRYL